MRHQIKFTSEEAVQWKNRMLQDPRVPFERDTQAVMNMFKYGGGLDALMSSAMHAEAMQDTGMRGYAIAYLRFQALGFNADPEICMLIASLADRPGIIVQYVSAVCIHVHEGNPTQRNITRHDYVDCFGETMLSQDTLRAAWGAQKREHVNGLDFLSFAFEGSETTPTEGT